MEALSERQQRILHLVLQEYTSRGIPVASKALAEEYGLRLSPATIRNELAVLEERGYLTHPHTSAGRIPTQLGYRYFVEFLLEEAELAAEEKRSILHQFDSVGMELEEWLKLAAAVLARISRSAAVVAAPQMGRSRFQRLELVVLHEKLAMAILILEQGLLRKRLLLADPGEEFSQEEFRQVANRFNALLVNLEKGDLAGRLGQLSLLEQPILGCVVSMMEEVDERIARSLYQDGLFNMLRQPELAQMAMVEETLQLLESGGLLTVLLGQALGYPGIQVIIGSEGRWEEMEHFSLVMSRYGLVDKAVGVLGVLGPVRMPYGRAISAVRYIAGLMSELVGTIYEG